MDEIKTNYIKPKLKMSLNNNPEELVSFEVAMNKEQQPINGCYEVVGELPQNNDEKELKETEYTSSYIRFSNETKKDEYQIIRSEIANLLSIKSSKVYKIYNEKGTPGIIIYDDKNKTHNFNEVFQLVEQQVRDGRLDISKYPEYNLPINISGEAINDEDTIINVLGRSIKIIIDNTKDKKDAQNNAVKEYIQLILLDILTNQHYRNGLDYKYYYSNEVKKETKTISTMVNNELEETTVKEDVVHVVPHIKEEIGSYDFDNEKQFLDNEYQLNGYIVDKDALLNVLLTTYFEYVKDIIKPLVSISDEYKECFSRIIYNNTDSKNANLIKNYIFQVLDKISKSNVYSFNDKETIESVSTTTKLRLEAIKKLTEVQSKYPEITEEPVEEEQVIEEDLGIKYKLEPSKPIKENKGYASAILISTTVAFICGLGVGIAYVILKLS